MHKFSVERSSQQWVSLRSPETAIRTAISFAKLKKWLVQFYPYRILYILFYLLCWPLFIFGVILERNESKLNSKLFVVLILTEAYNLDVLNSLTEFWLHWTFYSLYYWIEYLYREEVNADLLLKQQNNFWANERKKRELIKQQLDCQLYEVVKILQFLWCCLMIELDEIVIMRFSQFNWLLLFKSNQLQSSLPPPLLPPALPMSTFRLQDLIAITGCNTFEALKLAKMKCCLFVRHRNP